MSRGKGKIKAYQPTDPSAPLKKGRTKPKLCETCSLRPGCYDAKVYAREYCTDYSKEGVDSG